jgi:hypothetical protein
MVRILYENVGTSVAAIAQTPCLPLATIDTNSNASAKCLYHATFKAASRRRFRDRLVIGICLVRLSALRNTLVAGLLTETFWRIVVGGVIMTIKNGLYAVTSRLLDGEEGGASGVSVLQDGTMRGGGSVYYHTG